MIKGRENGVPKEIITQRRSRKASPTALLVVRRSCRAEHTARTAADIVDKGIVDQAEEAVSKSTLCCGTRPDCRFRSPTTR